MKIRHTWTVIANDGIIATAGILEGFAGAGANDRTVGVATLGVSYLIGSLFF